MMTTKRINNKKKKNSYANSNETYTKNVQLRRCGGCLGGTRLTVVSFHNVHFIILEKKNYVDWL